MVSFKTSIKSLAAVLLLAVVTLLGGCGGGGAADPFATAPPPPPLIVSPASLNIYAGTPSVVTINSGVGPFQVFTSDAVVLPVTQVVSGAAITLTASNVAADSNVTLTIRDAVGQSTAVAVAVRASPLLGALLVTPTSNTACAGAAASTSDKAAICSGETGVASITVRSTNTTVLPNRQIRFDVVQGNYNFIVNQAATTFAKTITLTTDQNGLATTVLRTDPGVPSQAVLIRATDLTSGNRVDATFTIVQATSGASTLSVVPQTYSGTGGFTGQCLSFSGDYVVFGGTPPYTITNGLPNAGTLTSGTSTGQVVTVPVQGGIFRYTSFPVESGCGGFTAPITIADATGRAIGTITFVVTAGSTARVPAVLSPSTVSFSANQGGTAAVAPEPEVRGCPSGTTLEGAVCRPSVTRVNACRSNTNLTAYLSDPAGAPFRTPDGIVQGAGCAPSVVVVPATTPPSCTNGGNYVPAAGTTPASCATATFVPGLCSNGSAPGADQLCPTVPSSVLVPAYAGAAATPNNQCSSRSVVFTINGGVTPYTLSSSLAGVTPATATVGSSPSNVTFTFPTLNTGVVVTITAVDGRGALFTATVTCAAST